MKNRGRLMISFAAALVIAGLLGLSFLNFFYRSQRVTKTLIVQDIMHLADIFQNIHKQCRILSFDNQQNRINFLNIATFAGSEVGPMNLAYPNKWQGPYLKDNPTIQSREYLVVHTKHGYFITPGNNVELPNGKVIGKDVILDENANIEAMMHDENSLYFKGQSFAKKLFF